MISIYSVKSVFRDNGTVAVRISGIERRLGHLRTGVRRGQTRPEVPSTVHFKKPGRGLGPRAEGHTHTHVHSHTDRHAQTHTHAQKHTHTQRQTHTDTHTLLYLEVFNRSLNLSTAEKQG